MRHPIQHLGPALAFLALALPAAGADFDALDLQAEPPAEAESADAKLFVEGSVGHAGQRYGLGSDTISRAAIDGRYAGRFGPAWQGVLSARLDASNPDDYRIDGTIFSLREAYMGWQDEGAANAAEFGRINLREGPGYGYNPTDFFRDNSLRSLSTVDPLALRNYRMGSVMLRGQHLWAGGSVSAAYSPKLEDGRSDEGFSLDLGATNARDRGVVSLGSRLSEEVNTQLSLYKEAGSSARLGASSTALLSEALVAHAEWSYSSEPDLVSRALMLPAADQKRARGVAGLTYTTATQLSVTAEYQYNGFALDREGWQALAQAGLPAQIAYYETAVSLQDNAARQAWLLYALQRDLGLKNLDLTALFKYNQTDRSHMAWLELRYRMDRADLALQLLRNSGDSGSEFGITRIQDSASLLLAVYF